LEEEARARLQDIEGERGKLDDARRDISAQNPVLGDDFIRSGRRDDFVRETVCHLATHRYSPAGALHPREFELLGVERAQPLV